MRRSGQAQAQVDLDNRRDERSQRGALNGEEAVDNEDDLINQEDVLEVIDDDEGHDDSSIPHILGIDDPRRMTLTKEEHHWALEIKRAVELLPELDNLSDFMYAQFAIITRGAVDDAIQRAFGLQEFRQEYGIMDNVIDGQRHLQNLIKAFPEQLLSFSFSHADGAYVLIHDVTKFDTSVLKSQSQINSWMAATYYLHSTMNPDIAAIRRGCIVLIEWYVLCCESFIA